jgi:hypothetical protein
MKDRISKLVLTKETLRTLTSPELARVHGGFETAYDDDQTNCIPGTNTCPGGCGNTGNMCGTFGCNSGFCATIQGCTLSSCQSTIPGCNSTG